MAVCIPDVSIAELSTADASVAEVSIAVDSVAAIVDEPEVRVSKIGLGVDTLDSLISVVVSRTTSDCSGPVVGAADGGTSTNVEVPVPPMLPRDDVMVSIALGTSFTAEDGTEVEAVAEVVSPTTLELTKGSPAGTDDGGGGGGEAANYD